LDYYKIYYKDFEATLLRNLNHDHIVTGSNFEYIMS